MYRYTTPKITLTISGIDFSEVSLFRVAFEKCNYRLVKDILPSDEGVNPDTNTIQLELTQKETADMSPGTVNIQVRIKFNNGRVAATDMIPRSIKDVIDEVEI